MGRTLYLNENKNDLWVLRDGPSVRIKGRERATQRVPVRLLSRVVIIGNVRLDAGAITLFTENDIPVVFMNRRAEDVAVAIPYNHRLPTHYREQKIFLESEDNICRFEDWANTKRMVMQVNMLKRLHRPIADKLTYGIGEGNYQKLLSQMKPHNEWKWMLVTGIATNLFRGLIIEYLLKADINPHLGVVHRRHNFGLALDICYIMGAESDMQSIQFFGCSKKNSYMKMKGKNWVLTDTGMRNIIQRFENRRAAMKNMVEDIIDELFELMRELRT